MNAELHTLLQADPGLRDALDSIRRGEETKVAGLKGSSKALFLAALHALTRRTVAVPCAGPDAARSLAQDAASFAGHGDVPPLLRVHVPAQPDLPDIAGTYDRPAALPRGNQRGSQKGHQHRNDPYDDQHLNEGKGGSAARPPSYERP